MKKGFDLTVEEHMDAADLIGDLQDRIATLSTRKDGHLKTTCRTSSYEPTIHTVKIGDEIIVVKVRASEVRVSIAGKQVVSVTGLNLDEIDFDGLRRAMAGIQRYMILDDLANI
jgi:hypothetical protein